jgi:hypothetical protein
LSGLVDIFGLVEKPHLSLGFAKQTQAQKQEKEILDSHVGCFLFSG